VPLVEEGRRQAREMAGRVPADIQVYHAPNDRSAETGKTVSARAQPADWLEPWKLGAHEGKPLESEREPINARIVNRPDEAPGVSPTSGEAGESFNAFRKRIVGGILEQRKGMDPGAKTLNITSGRALQIVDAWAKAGGKPNASVDAAEITAEKGEFSKPGQLFRLGGAGLEPVERVEGPGQYFAQHGATEWNKTGGERNSAPQPLSEGGGRERPAAPEAERGARAPSADAAHRDAEPAAAARPAAAVSSQPAQPPQPPNESPTDDGVYLGSGLGALEPLFRESKAEGDALRLKRNAALKGIEEARESPQEHRAGEKLRNYFTAERDLWALRANQALDIVTRKILPKMQDREAVGIMREFRHKRAELLQFIEGTHPFLDDVAGGAAGGEMNLDKLQPVMRQALRMMDKPTDREAEADRLYTNLAETSLAEGRKGGWLESRWQPDEYLPHLLNAKGEGEVAKLPATVGRRQGKIGKYFGFAERRSDLYPTMVHAVADGLIPRTLDASAAFNIHADNFARARATHLLEGQLAVSGLGKWGVAKNAPEGWVPLAGHSEEFSKLVPFMRAGGSEEAAQAVAAAKLAGQVPMGAGNPEDVPDVAVHKLFVPPFVEKALSPVTAPDYLAREVPGFARMRTAQRGLKQAILGLSGFHLLTENAMAKADVGVRGMLRAFRADRTSPWFIEQERDLVGSGGTSAVQGNTMDAYRGLRPGTIPTRAEVIRAYIPGSKQALELADTITRFTFENVQRRFKVVSFALHRDAWMRDNPTATPDQASEAKRGIASYVNGVYGGLHWENMGWSRAMLEVGRAALLAPDWSGSNVALAKYAFDAPLSRAEFGRHPLEGATTKESAQARLARAFWAKQLVQGLTENQMLSLMFSGRLSPRPFQVYLGRDDDGNEVYQNVVFRGSIGDAVSLGTKLEEHGLLGAGLFVGSKAAPFAKLGMHLVTGRNDFGQQIAPAGRGLVRNTLDTGAAVAADVSPVPLVLRSVQKDTLGDDSDKYLWSERILSLFGPLGQHVDPDRGWRNRE
jgi:broad specificity phosphatase PhoE